MYRPLTIIIAAALAHMAGAQKTINTVDELAADKTYTLYNPHFTAYAIYSPDDHTTYVWTAEMTDDEEHKLKDTSYSQPFNPTSPYSAWMVVSHNRQTYIYNVGAQKFLKVGETGGTQATTLQDDPTPVSIHADDSHFTFLTTEGSRNYMCAAPQMSYPVSVWTADDDGATWIVEENSYVPADYETCIALLKDKVPLTGNLTIKTRNGNLYATPQGTPLPDNIPLGKSLTISAQSLSGYICKKGITIRHGHNLGGPQYIGAEQQWREYTIEATRDITTIPADSIDGDVMITALWTRNDDQADILVFSDEFDGQGQPDATFWTPTPRAGSTWNRWCSDDSRVAYQQDGALHLLAIPTPHDTGDTTPMITGGIKSQGLFTFQYGHVEARIKTNQHTGNFPAFWMMPADNTAGWPNAGEIDIWETIDNTSSSWHTVHTNWTYNLHQGTNSQTMNNLDYSLWHTYAADWDENSITWYVDGNPVWSYTKSSDTYALSNGQWPFDAPFYLILNQSVGNGTWAANADTSHTYHTLFDWVRVYQPVSITAINEIAARDRTTEDREQGTENKTQTTNLKPQIYFDLQGRPVTNPTHGIYISKGKKILR